MHFYLNETLCPKFLVVNAAYVERSLEVRCDQPLRGTLERFTYDPDAIRPDPNGHLPATDGTLALGGGWSDRIPARGVRLYRTTGRLGQCGETVACVGEEGP